MPRQLSGRQRVHGQMRVHGRILILHMASHSLALASRSLLMELCTTAPSETLWGLLRLTHAHKLQAEMRSCCEVPGVLIRLLLTVSALCATAVHESSQALARSGGKFAGNAGLAAVQCLDLESLGHLLSSDAWVVSLESELLLVVEAWLKGQPWVNWSKKGAQPEKAPPHIYAASATWGIRWGHVHSELRG